jgi:hypothetical protein
MIWYKQGVCGDLSNQCRKALGRIADHNSAFVEDTYVTSVRDGNHMNGSLHYNGNAFDIRKGRLSKHNVVTVVGPGFDVIEHSTHFHIEFDPKG